MATTNSTANYNLPQWTADDKVGVMANLNPAFNTIDQKLHEAVVNADNASTVSSSASQVANSANTLANKVDGEMTEVQAVVLTLQNLVNSLNSNFNKFSTFTSLKITNNTDVITSSSYEKAFKNIDNSLFFFNTRCELVATNITNVDLFTISNLNLEFDSTFDGVVFLEWVKDDVYHKSAPPLRIDTNGSCHVIGSYDLSSATKCYISVNIGTVINVTTSN